MSYILLKLVVNIQIVHMVIRLIEHSLIFHFFDSKLLKNVSNRTKNVGVEETTKIGNKNFIGKKGAHVPRNSEPVVVMLVGGQ